MVKNVPNVPAVEGNTGKDTSTASGALYWCFTHWFDDKKIEPDKAKEEFVPKLKKLLSILKNFSVSLEEGDKTKGRHLQGFLAFKKGHKQRKTQIIKALWKTTHCEKCIGNEEQNEKYCEKNPLWNLNYTEYKKVIDAEILDILPAEKLYDWQLDIIDIVKNKPQKRIVNWYWSCCGNIGKTEFIKHLCHYYNCSIVGGNKKDIMCNILGKDGSKEIKQTYIINLPRSNENISYDAIESIKDGLLVSNKYESNSKIIPVPTLIIFANKEPDYKKLSVDRWKVKKLCYCVDNCYDDLE